MGRTLKIGDHGRGRREGQCLFVVPSPADSLLYACFRAIAQRRQPFLSAERLWIEGGVLLSSGLTLDLPPATISKLVGGDLQIISRLEVEFGDLYVCFARAGGHGPQIFRESFFDEIRIERMASGSRAEIDVRELVKELDAFLDVSAAMVSGEFCEIANEFDARKPTSIQGSLPF
jgi:hypothetical protein